MADVSLVQSGSNNGTLTPATPGSLTLTNHNLAVLVVVVIGSVTPTISTPASWSLVRSGGIANSLTMAMFVLPNNPGGATNPSCTLGGTFTGWVAAMFEFNNTGTNEAVLNSAINGNTGFAQLGNIFSGLPVIYNELFIYSVARPTATIIAQNTNGSWSNSVQPLAGIQGISLDTYWMSNQQQGYWPPPSASGLLSSSVNSAQIGAILNSAATTVATTNNIGGLAGAYVGQGLIAPTVGGSASNINSGYGGEVPGNAGGGGFFSGMIGG